MNTFEKTLKDSSLLLMAFVTLNHLLVLFSFATVKGLLPYTFPLSFILPALLLFLIGKHKSLKQNISIFAVSLAVIVFSLLIASFYFDLSWDGQWYHQSAIYHMVSDWNPLKDPIRDFEIHNSSSICHFPKGSWYFAASVYSFTGNFEAGKGLNIIVPFIALFYIFASLRELKLSFSKSLVISVIVILNPVVWCEITSYLVDGLLILYISIYLTAAMLWIKQRDNKSMLMAAMAISALVNVKFTGLVFFCALAFFLFIYLLLVNRKHWFKFAYLHAVILAGSLLIAGYNPYITNYVERNHPLYPIMGTEEYPSVFEATGEDSNELLETPHNMMGKNLIHRMFYATFGRPDNAPYYKKKDASLMWPFMSNTSDWEAYYFHEVRVSGFGPYFSATIILALVLSVTLLIRDKTNRLKLLMAALAVLSTLMFSRHLWWPRFGPQMWLLPLIPLIFSFFSGNRSKTKYLSYSVAALLLINGIIVMWVHMGWETRSSVTLRKQLTELKTNNTSIEINYGWFGKAIEERLDFWQINYESIPRKEIKNSTHKKMVSVVNGYPNVVLYRDKENETTAVIN
ncbi:hypothetical protein ACE01N_18590 [Saccharicrinis sp. FJH2]|uniref:hypothetical protein n=1 Tax=Saccharicrinis sp. FJH65 TaxID=3344659 RepID=UPI0035F38F87